MQAPDRIATARVVGERLGEEDWDLFGRLLAVAADISLPQGMWSGAALEGRAQLHHWLEHWDVCGVGPYLLSQREGGANIGWGGLALSPGPSSGHGGSRGTSQAALFVTLTRDEPREELLAEIAGELVRLAFDVLGLCELVAFPPEESNSARGALRRVGFKPPEEPGGGMPPGIYRLRATDGTAALTPFDQTTQLFTARAREGDREAFADLYERVVPALRAWVRLRTTPAFRARLDPEEVVQETWARALRRIDEFPRDRLFRPWLFRVARYVLIELSRGLPRGRAAGAASSLLERQVDGASGAVTRAARADALEAFLARAEQTSPPDRELIVLRGLEGLSFDEIARRRGASPDAVRKRWQRLRARLTAEGPPAYLL